MFPNWHRRWLLAAAIGPIAITAAGVICFASGVGPTAAAAVRAGGGPGARVLLDAHNAYPYQGQWADRIDRALSTGVPLAIEQDLV